MPPCACRERCSESITRDGRNQSDPSRCMHLFALGSMQLARSFPRVSSRDSSIVDADRAFTPRCETYRTLRTGAAGGRPPRGVGWGLPARFFAVGGGKGPPFFLGQGGAEKHTTASE